jgi:hypothetical protein
VEGVVKLLGLLRDGGGVQRVGCLFHHAKKAVNFASITNTNQYNQ